VGALRTPFALAAIVVGIVCAAVQYFSGDDDPGGWLVVCAIVLVAAGVVFWVVVPRVRRFGRGSLILGVLAILSLPVFWLDLAPVLSAGAGLLGAEARASRGEVRSANVGLALAVLALAVYVVATFAG
jgi:hypothetical protein